MFAMPPPYSVAQHRLERAIAANRAAREAWTELAEAAQGVYRSDITFGPEQDYLSPYHKIVVGGASIGGFIGGLAVCPPLINLGCALVGANAMPDGAIDGTQ